MIKGNLSNSPTPKLLLVFEGGLASLSPEEEQAFEKLCRRGKWDQAIRRYKINDLMAKKIMWLLWYKNTRIDLVTFLGDDLAGEIKDYVDDENVPCTNVYSSTPERLARKIAFMPEVFAVYDPNPDHALTYGRKGRVLRGPVDLG